MVTEMTATNWNKVVPLVLVTAVIHTVATQFVWKKGTQVYTKNECLSNNRIYDIIHDNVEDLSMYNYTKNWYLLVFLVPYLINFGSVQHFVYRDITVKLCLIIILRSLTIGTTILPKSGKCEVENLNAFHLTIGGTCYDKMFSGHFAFGLLMTLVAFKYNLLNSSATNVVGAIIVNALHFLIIAATRSHYTMDIVVSVYVTLLVSLLVDSGWIRI